MTRFTLDQFDAQKINSHGLAQLRGGTSASSGKGLGGGNGGSSGPGSGSGSSNTPPPPPPKPGDNTGAVGNISTGGGL
ncbi:MAG: hypothetical protein AAFQ98_22710 [Bacteroidota bacterium]